MCRLDWGSAGQRANGRLRLRASRASSCEWVGSFGCFSGPTCMALGGPEGGGIQIHRFHNLRQFHNLVRQLPHEFPRGVRVTATVTATARFRWPGRWVITAATTHVGFQPPWQASDFGDDTRRDATSTGAGVSAPLTGNKGVGFRPPHWQAIGRRRRRREASAPQWQAIGLWRRRVRLRPLTGKQERATRVQGMDTCAFVLEKRTAHEGNGWD